MQHESSNHSGQLCILCIDTSGEVCQAGVGTVVNNEFRLIAQAMLADRKAHSENMIDLIDFSLRKARMNKHQLTLIAVSAGPGSFTGLRIGISVAKGMGLALGIPVIPVSTHDAMVEPFRSFPFPILTMNTARKDEWYLTRYHGHECSSTTVMKAEQWLKLIHSPVIVVADDYSRIRAYLSSEIAKSLIFPNECYSVLCLGSLGKLALGRYRAGDIPDIDSIEPIYIQPFLGKI